MVLLSTNNICFGCQISMLDDFVWLPTLKLTMCWFLSTVHLHYIYWEQGTWCLDVLCPVLSNLQCNVKLSRFGRKSDVCVLLLVLSAIMFILMIIEKVDEEGPAEKWPKMTRSSWLGPIWPQTELTRIGLKYHMTQFRALPFWRPHSVNVMWVKFKTGLVEAVERFILSKMT